MKAKRLAVLLISVGVALMAGRMLWTDSKSPRSVAFDTWPPREWRANLDPLLRNPTANPRPGELRRNKGADEGPPVVHTPASPKSGEPVLVVADLRGRPKPSTAGELLLEYQLVEPGNYVALADPAFETTWTPSPLNDQGVNGDATAGDNLFSVQLPADLQKHRRLVRYRIRASRGGNVVAPGEGDALPNFAYFVYDGIPSWRGAIDPRSRDRRLREPVTFSPEALQQVPVYHFISSKRSVEEVTWRARGHFGSARRNEYFHTGTMVYEGVVYDHIEFRARGGGWRHAMGKNMWKFNFLPGHRFEARDHYGRRYNAKWDKLNLGACIQQGDYGMRGEQGMFEAVGFRMFNLAGVEAPRTHWVHLRIIDEAEESPADQYAGDFWGLYLAVENIDDHFLKEHNLPSGNLYKMDFGPKTAHNGEPEVSDQSDVHAFMGAVSRRQPEAWWHETVDLPRYFSYRAILECIHHYDIDAGKNYFYYHNPVYHKWVVLPWDIDLSWGDHMFGGGHEPFYRAGVLAQPALRRQYRERMAEIRDLLFNPEAIGRLIDEHAAMISNPNGAPSLVDADRAKWDYHPIMESQYVMAGKAGRGRFYFANARNNFGTMVEYMKTYAQKRARWIDKGLLAGYEPPPPPKIISAGRPSASAPALRFQLAASPRATQVCRWRLAEITDPASPNFNPREPWKHEIESVWEQESQGAPAIEIPPRYVAAGRIYRVRARWQDESGAWSRWSAPAEFSLGK